MVDHGRHEDLAAPEKRGLAAAPPSVAALNLLSGTEVALRLRETLSHPGAARSLYSDKRAEERTARRGK